MTFMPKLGFPTTYPRGRLPRIRKSEKREERRISIRPKDAIRSYHTIQRKSDSRFYPPDKT